MAASPVIVGVDLGLAARAAVGVGRVGATQPMVFSADETTDIGDDFGMPVASEYTRNSRFNGKIELVQIDIGDDSHDHLVNPEELIRVAMSRQ